ncbi:type II secretion system F family protein [Vibrio cyclitrophicus]|nr:type II secretion system F family protein [Vibrio cyclitrophicus]UPR55228.1 type II secretion system F family protein [Vibrio cyclitrophicus]
MLWVALILGSIAILMMRGDKKKKINQYFDFEDSGDLANLHAININELTNRKRWQSLMSDARLVADVLGPRSALYITLYTLGTAFMLWYVMTEIARFGSLWMFVVMWLALLFIGYRYLVNRRRKLFTNSFPDVLNMLMSAVTAGDSLMHAIGYVGEKIDTTIGHEFKLMSERLKMGEAPEVVLDRACRHYPYPEFVFFTLALKANLARGGQLKNVLARLIRVLVDTRTLEKKKMSMTSEARVSAKIVAAIPLGFTILISQIAPHNLEILMEDPIGNWVIIYVIGSELLGLFIVWLLVKGVSL